MNEVGILPHIPLPQTCPGGRGILAISFLFPQIVNTCHFRTQMLHGRKASSKLPFPDASCVEKPPVSPAAVFLRWPCRLLGVISCLEFSSVPSISMQSAYAPVYSFIISHPATIGCSVCNIFPAFCPVNVFMAGLAIWKRKKFSFSPSSDHHIHYSFYFRK